MKFYGVQKGGEPVLEAIPPSMDLKDVERLDADILKVGQTFFGPHPKHATISGAGLSMDPAAQLNTAPFMGTELFVMWIDDHLLDGMAREILGTSRQAYAKSFIGRSPIVRPNPVNPARYTLEFYMKTLTLGAIMAKFVNANPHSYLFRYWDDEMGGSSDDLTKLLTDQNMTSRDAQGLYTKAIRECRNKASPMTDGEKDELKPKLWQDAFERIKDVYWQWSHLPEPEVDGKKTATFASLWVTSRLCKHPQLKVYCEESFDLEPMDKRFAPQCGAGLVTEDWDAKAKTAESRSKLPEITEADIKPCMKGKIETMMESAFNHIDWLLSWPLTIQAFWTIPMGKLPSDLVWELPAK